MVLAFKNMNVLISKRHNTQTFLLLNVLNVMLFSPSLSHQSLTFQSRLPFEDLAAHIRQSLNVTNLQVRHRCIYRVLRRQQQQVVRHDTARQLIVIAPGRWWWWGWQRRPPHRRRCRWSTRPCCWDRRDWRQCHRRADRCRCRGSRRRVCRTFRWRPAADDADLCWLCPVILVPKISYIFIGISWYFKFPLRMNRKVCQIQLSDFNSFKK